MSRWLVVLLAVMAAAAAGCIGSGDAPNPEQTAASEQAPAELPEPVTVVTDPAGDATQKNSDWAREASPCIGVQDAPEDAPGSCSVTDPALARQQPAGGAPAHPARDLLDARFRETPKTLEVSLDVAQLDESLDGAIQEDDTSEGVDGTGYVVAWEDPASGCTNGVVFGLSPDLEAVSRIAYLFVGCQAVLEEDGGRIPGPCTAPVCSWRIPFEIEHGAPATLHWSVPRTMLAGGQAGATIPSPVAEAVSIASDEGASGQATQVRGPVTTSQVGPNGWDTMRFDRSQPGENYTFETQGVEPRVPSGSITVSDEDVRVEEEIDRPDLRITNMTLTPHPERFSIDVALEAVEEEPTNHTLSVDFGIPGHSTVLGYVARGGQRQPFANRIGASGNPVSIPVSVDVEPGTPGHVTFEVLRSDLPPIPEGAIIQDLGAVTQIFNGTETSIGGVEGETEHPVEGDGLIGVPFHRLPASSTNASRGEAVRVGDAPDDVDPPRDLTGSTARFDLLGTEIVSPAPDEMRFSMTISDLSDLTPPRGYDAIFYAVGIEHPNGQTMVGHYSSHQRPGGQFLCAPDTTVLSDTMADPKQTAWTRIDGTILTSSSGGGGEGAGTGGAGGTGASGSIVVTAPPSCFGLQDGAEQLNATAMEAGSYLIRRPPAQTAGTEVRELDRLSSENGFETAFAEPAQPPPPGFWAQPFGIENFWDIFGGLMAVLTVGITAGLWLRRRWTFKRYLDEVRRIQRDYRGSAQARARELVDLRRDLYEDLEANRISDSHYPIVLDRLRARLTSARLASIGQAFYHLPPHLALRIEAMLDDGQLAEEEAQVLEPIIEESEMEPESSQVLRERLRRWVEEDREHLDSNAASTA